MRFIHWCLVVLALLAAAPATADWREARSKHFILTIDADEADARAMAERLERFDAALRRLYDVKDGPDERPVRVYDLKGPLFHSVAGFNELGDYRERAAESLIFSAQLRDQHASKVDFTSQAVLFHEYSHHFTFTHFPNAYPFWFTEGFAEFNANSRVNPDGSIEIGYPANYRGASIKSGIHLPYRQLFDPFRYGFGDSMDLVYGRGWLLTHYLVLGGKRPGQLARYLSAIAAGKPSLEAAQASFGDLRKLDAELDAYARGVIAPPVRVPPGPAPAVTITTLSPGRAAMMPFWVRAEGGINKDYGLGAVLGAAGIAARYPDDPVIQAQAARVMLAADRPDRAGPAADAALARDPANGDALLVKAWIAIRQAHDAPSPAAWAAARPWLLKANRADPNAALPLLIYYQSFIWAKMPPTPGAVRGLMRAAMLAPESRAVRLALAHALLAQGDLPGAKDALSAVVYAPHRTAKDNLPDQALAALEAGKADPARAALTQAIDRAATASFAE